MSYMLAEIKCPFFVSETEKNLMCEGAGKDVKNTMRFPDKKAKMEYMRKHCVHFPNECHLFKATWENKANEGM